jgi:3-hydroxyacyl-[acyl-carrier-protein] dehydratase
MLLVDQIESYEAEALIASTVVKEQSPFVDGHFPGYPILPGVILVEMMYQACGLYGGLSAIYGDKFPEGKWMDVDVSFEEFTRDLKARSIGIDKLVFKKPVYPNDELVIIVKPLKRFLNFSTYEGEIRDKATNEQVVKGKLTVFLGKNG